MTALATSGYLARGFARWPGLRGGAGPVLDEAECSPSWGTAASCLGSVHVHIYIYIYTHIHLYNIYTADIFIYVSWPQAHLGSGLFPGSSPGRLFPLRTPWVEWGWHRRERGAGWRQGMVGPWGGPCPFVCAPSLLGQMSRRGRASWSTGERDVPLASVPPLRIWAVGAPGELEWAEILPGRCPRATPLEAWSKTHSLPNTTACNAFSLVIGRSTVFLHGHSAQ